MKVPESDNDYTEYYVKAVEKEMGRRTKDIDMAMELAMVPDNLKSKVKDSYLNKSQ